jgi:hypothetical protein
VTSVASVVASVVSGAVGLAGGAAAGHALGRRYGQPKWRFWAMCAAALVACSVLCAVGLMLGQRWFAVGALGLLGGLLTGLKYGAWGRFLAVAEE